MAQSSINIRMDEDLKRSFDQFCKSVGMNMSTAVTLYAKTVVREQQIPFGIYSGLPNAETVAAIKEVERMKADPSIGKTYTDVDKMMEELLA